MPAITADTVALPRVPGAGLGDTDRPVRSITAGPRGFEGEGFPVVRTMAGVPAAALDPFIMMDEMGEVDYAPGEPKGTSWHPHRGFETVTYIMEGTFLHQDSHGGGGVISNGATQWMTAGGGILHIETPPEDLVMAGGLFHGVQLWVNLPAARKFIEPAYQNLKPGQVALAASSDGGALLRVIAGEIPTTDGTPLRGPGSTQTPITMVHASISPGASLSLPWPADFNGLAYVLSGSGTVGPEASPIRGQQLAVFGKGDRLTLTADLGQDSRHPAMEVLLLGGAPLREPVVQYGPFVMNTRQQLIEAVEDYQAGRLGVIPEGALMPHTGR